MARQPKPADNAAVLGWLKRRYPEDAQKFDARSSAHEQLWAIYDNVRRRDLKKEVINFNIYVILNNNGNLQFSFILDSKTESGEARFIREKKIEKPGTTLVGPKAFDGVKDYGKTAMSLEIRAWEMTKKRSLEERKGLMDAMKMFLRREDAQGNRFETEQVIKALLILIERGISPRSYAVRILGKFARLKKDDFASRRLIKLLKFSWVDRKTVKEAIGAMGHSDLSYLAGTWNAVFAEDENLRSLVKGKVLKNMDVFRGLVPSLPRLFKGEGNQEDARILVSHLDRLFPDPEGGKTRSGRRSSSPVEGIGTQGRSGQNWVREWAERTRREDGETWKQLERMFEETLAGMITQEPDDVPEEMQVGMKTTAQLLETVLAHFEEDILRTKEGTVWTHLVRGHFMLAPAVLSLLTGAGYFDARRQAASSQKGGADPKGSTSSPVGYRAISSVFEENLRKISKCLRTFNPSRPLTLLFGGMSRQITSMFFKVVSHIWKAGTVTIDTYSVPLAVRISIFRRDFVGSQPILKAASPGMLVRVAPVSNAIVRNIGLPFNPFTATSMGIKFNLGLKGYSGMEGESRGVAFREIILRVADKNRIFGAVFGDFLVNDRSVRIVVKKRSGYGFRIFNLFNPNQKPLVLESLLDILDSFYLHSIHLQRNDTTFAGGMQYEISASSPMDEEKVHAITQDLPKEMVNYFDRKRRETIRNVVYVAPWSGLSYPILFAWVILPVLERNFPNADIQIYSHVAPLLKFSGRVRMVSADVRDTLYLFDELREDSLIFATMGSSIHAPRSHILGVSANTLVDLKPAGRPARKIRLVSVPDISSYEMQSAFLHRLGFEGLGNGLPVTLSENLFGDALQGEIAELRKTIPSISGKPAVLVNPLRGKEGDWWPSWEKWVPKLEDLARNFEGFVIINEGPPSWEKTGARQEIMKLYRHLEGIHGRKAEFVEAGSNDILRLAALMHLSAAVFTTHTGVLHLADWMDKPTLAFIDSWFFHHLLKRRNLLDLFSGEGSDLGAVLRQWAGRISSKDASSPVEGSQEITPIWPGKSPDRTNLELENTIKRVLLKMEVLFFKINSDIRTKNGVTKNVLLILLEVLHELTGDNDVLFEEAVRRAENVLGWPSDESSFEKWLIFIRGVLFNLNISLFVKHGWLMDIGYDEQRRLRPRRERVKHFEILNDEGQPVIIVQADSDDGAVAGNRILYDSVGSFIDPAVVVLKELTDQNVDEVYETHLDFAHDESNKELSPSATNIVGQIVNVGKEAFRDIYRQHVLSEEWGHYREFREREKLQRGAMSMSDAVQIRRHLDIAFPTDSRHPIIKAIRDNFNIYLQFHEKQGHPIGHEMILVITETGGEARRLYFAPSYEHSLVALADITADIFSRDDIQRESARIVLYFLEKALKGESGPKDDKELESFVRGLNSFIALPEIAKLTPQELYAKLKSWRGKGDSASSPVEAKDKGVAIKQNLSEGMAWFQAAFNQGERELLLQAVRQLQKEGRLSLRSFDELVYLLENGPMKPAEAYRHLGAQFQVGPSMINRDLVGRTDRPQTDEGAYVYLSRYLLGQTGVNILLERFKGKLQRQAVRLLLDSRNREYYRSWLLEAYEAAAASSRSALAKEAFVWLLENPGAGVTHIGRHLQRPRKSVEKALNGLYARMRPHLLSQPEIPEILYEEYKDGFLKFWDGPRNADEQEFLMNYLDGMVQEVKRRKETVLQPSLSDAEIRDILRWRLMENMSYPGIRRRLGRGSVTWLHRFFFGYQYQGMTKDGALIVLKNYLEEDLRERLDEIQARFNIQTAQLRDTDEPTALAYHRRTLRLIDQLKPYHRSVKNGVILLTDRRRLIQFFALWHRKEKVLQAMERLKNSMRRRIDKERLGDTDLEFSDEDAADDPADFLESSSPLEASAAAAGRDVLAARLMPVGLHEFPLIDPAVRYLGEKSPVALNAMPAWDVLRIEKRIDEVKEASARFVVYLVLRVGAYGRTLWDALRDFLHKMFAWLFDYIFRPILSSVFAGDHGLQSGEEGEKISSAAVPDSADHVLKTDSQHVGALVAVSSSPVIKLDDQVWMEFLYSQLKLGNDKSQKWAVRAAEMIVAECAQGCSDWAENNDFAEMLKKEIAQDSRSAWWLVVEEVKKKNPEIALLILPHGDLAAVVTVSSSPVSDLRDKTWLDYWEGKLAKNDAASEELAVELARRALSEKEAGVRFIQIVQRKLMDDPDSPFKKVLEKVEELNSGREVVLK